ncbi:hypothetical protein Sjap_023954 [Stephania japonica]|uniref:RRM domain-containing protein n=1 Tax=Stephania japonica TaxID=461633 RepID=A0AAP0HN95_9MAGN
MGSDYVVDDKSDRRLYIGNLDQRITEAALIKMFSPFGKIVSEDFLWHTRGPKRGEPRGYAFIQYNTIEFIRDHYLTSTIEVSMQEAQLAKEKMNGRLACGRPLVVHFASEKYLLDAAANSSRGIGETSRPKIMGSSSGQMSRGAKIAAIKNKLKTMEEESCRMKKPRQGDNIT